jgi:hypothetical protein
MAKPIWKFWGLIRHVLSVRGLLQWIGVWQIVVTLIVSQAVAVWSSLKGVAAPIAVVIGLVSFASVAVALLALRYGKNFPAIPPSLTEGAESRLPVASLKRFRSTKFGALSDAKRRLMSQEEQDLIRIRTWDAYREALESFLTHRGKLTAWGKMLAGIADALTDRQLQVSEEDFSKAPTDEEFRQAVREFRQSITTLKRTWIDARGLGFPVDETVPKQVGGI